MQRNVYAVLILALASGPAWSQSSSDHRLSGHHSSSTVLNDRQCLVRKSTGRVECRPMREWRKLARKDDRARARASAD
jgi:hypothetical protein